jgi:hypothetical protein
LGTKDTQHCNLVSLGVAVVVDRVSLCIPGYAGTHDPPALASQVLGLQACPMTTGIIVLIQANTTAISLTTNAFVPSVQMSTQ